MSPTTEGNPSELSIKYIEHDLKQVLQYFVNSYKLQEGEIYNFDAFVDTAKDKVMFRLFIKTPKENK